MSTAEIARIALLISFISIFISVLSIIRSNISDFSKEKMAAIQELLSSKVRYQVLRNSLYESVESLEGDSRNSNPLASFDAAVENGVVVIDRSIEQLSKLNSKGFHRETVQLRQLMNIIRIADSKVSTAELEATRKIKEFKNRTT